MLPSPLSTSFLAALSQEPLIGFQTLFKLFFTEEQEYKTSLIRSFPHIESSGRCQMNFILFKSVQIIQKMMLRFRMLMEILI